MIIIQYCEVIGLRKAIHGMRNAMNSWDKSDSKELFCDETDIECWDCPYRYEGCDQNPYKKKPFIGPADMKLAKSLIKAGSSDRKFLRMIHVQVDILAPLYFWKESDQYKVGTTTNSCSTMHTLHKRELKIDDFSHEHLTGDGLSSLESIIGQINFARQAFIETNDTSYWQEMIQLLPSSYNQLRTWDLDYETLMSIYFQRRYHKLDEWRQFCDWIRKLPYMEEFISVLDKKDTEARKNIDGVKKGDSNAMSYEVSNDYGEKAIIYTECEGGKQ